MKYKGAGKSNAKTLEIGNQGGNLLISFCNTGLGKYNAQDDSESRTDWGPEHGRGNAKHNNAIEDELNVASQNGATDIRKNRVQVDADGNRVYYSGHRYTRPDASYIIGGTRYNTNYVSNYMLDNPAEISREWEAFINMQNADPNAVNMLVLIY